MSKSDIQLKTDIEEELLWDPKINSAQVGVSVDNGAVSLLGAVDTYAEKWAAEDAVKRVSGVVTIAQDLTVKIQSAHKHIDSEIAVAIQSALRWHVYVPSTVTAEVQDGNVTLGGQVRWNYQRNAAEAAIRYITGVVAVHNLISIKAHTTTAQVKEKVLAALQRQATTDAKSILIESVDGKVILSGHASSWQSIEDARNAAWAAPGVTEVVDEVKMLTTL